MTLSQWRGMAVALLSILVLAITLVAAKPEKEAEGKLKLSAAKLLLAGVGGASDRESYITALKEDHPDWAMESDAENLQLSLRFSEPVDAEQLWAVLGKKADGVELLVKLEGQKARKGDRLGVTIGGIKEPVVLLENQTLEDFSKLPDGQKVNIGGILTRYRSKYYLLLRQSSPRVITCKHCNLPLVLDNPNAVCDVCPCGASKGSCTP